MTTILRAARDAVVELGRRLERALEGLRLTPPRPAPAPVPVTTPRPIRR
ncbi:MAG TPA: hypothetical protein VFT20_08320 [Candidatus Limnocylindrales bacterium]|nr:hypothetical protein [Candidatus Limnocylindrales bacterium]